MAAEHSTPAKAAAENAAESAETGTRACTTISTEEMVTRAEAASAFLKALAHEGRLMILCHLSGGERSVTELEQLLAVRQAAVSQQLSRLRDEGLVAARREGKAIYYSLADSRAQRLIALMYEMFCAPEAKEDARLTSDAA